MRFSIVHKQILVMVLLSILPLFIVFFISTGDISGFSNAIIGKSEGAKTEVLTLMASEKERTLDIAVDSVESISRDSIVTISKLMAKEANLQMMDKINYEANFQSYVEGTVDSPILKGIVFVLDSDSVPKAIVSMNEFSTNSFKNIFDGVKMVDSDDAEVKILANDMLAGHEGFRELSIGGLKSKVAFQSLDQGWSLGVAIPSSFFDTPTANLERSIMMKEEEVNEELTKILEEINEKSTSTLVSVKKSLLSVMIIIAFSASVFAFVLAKGITNPIMQLRDVADKATDGDFDVKLPQAKIMDEVTDLTASMEMLLMALKIKSKKKNKKK